MYMRKIITILMFVFVSFTIYSQNQATDSTRNSLENNQIETKTIYKLYPTTNTWTFIKLNTRNGKLWQVQWHLEDDKRFETILDTRACVAPEDESNERFILYPTQNMYNFILLDQIDGRMWQVQWSIDRDKRFAVRIY